MYDNLRRFVCRTNSRSLDEKPQLVYLLTKLYIAKCPGETCSMLSLLLRLRISYSVKYFFLYITLYNKVNGLKGSLIGDSEDHKKRRRSDGTQRTAESCAHVLIRVLVVAMARQSSVKFSLSLRNPLWFYSQVVLTLRVNITLWNLDTLYRQTKSLEEVVVAAIASSPATFVGSTSVN